VLEEYTYLSSPEALGLVLGEGDATILNVADVVDEDLEVAAHLLGGLGAPHGAGHLLPEIGRALAVVGERLLEHLVLLLAPLRVGARRGAPRR
jgi:hypothetical protein